MDIIFLATILGINPYNINGMQERKVLRKTIIQEGIRCLGISMLVDVQDLTSVISYKSFFSIRIPCQILQLWKFWAQDTRLKVMSPGIAPTMLQLPKPSQLKLST